MVLALVAIIGATAIASAIPFFFPTKGEQASIELNEKLNSNQFILQPIRTSETQETKPFELDNKKIFLIFVVIAIILIAVGVVKTR